MLIKYLIPLLIIIPLSGCGDMRPVDEWSGEKSVARSRKVCRDKTIELANKAAETCELAYKMNANIYKSDCLHEYRQVKYKRCDPESNQYPEWQTAMEQLNTIFKKCNIPKGWL
jgi:hypothetical protein